MDMKDIKDIIEITGKLNIAHLELEKEGFRLLIKNYADSNNEMRNEVSYDKEITAVETSKSSQENVKEDNAIFIKSPMVGTFYAASSPDAKPFVEAGSKVKIGDTLCIIEAMKVMNEITSEYDGEILEVFVTNGQIVEYGQPIMSIRK